RGAAFDGRIRSASPHGAPRSPCGSGAAHRLSGGQGPAARRRRWIPDRVAQPAWSGRAQGDRTNPDSRSAVTRSVEHAKVTVYVRDGAYSVEPAVDATAVTLGLADGV